MARRGTFGAALALIAGLAAGSALAADTAGEATGGQAAGGEHEAMMEAWVASMKPGPQHAELADLAGTWTVKSRYWMTPDAEPEESQGTAERTMMFDGLILREAFVGDFEGEPYRGVGYTGYDNVTDAYWANWMDNMMTGIVQLTGRWDEAEGQWIYEGTYPDPMAGGLTPMRIETRMQGEDRQISEFYRPGPDGEMFRNMILVYERQ